jgi:hypothetical protein
MLVINFYEKIGSNTLWEVAQPLSSNTAAATADSASDIARGASWAESVSQSVSGLREARRAIFEKSDISDAKFCDVHKRCLSRPIWLQS